MCEHRLLRAPFFYVLLICYWCLGAFVLGVENLSEGAPSTKVTQTSAAQNRSHGACLRLFAGYPAL
jgi:hypothetical protein